MNLLGDLLFSVSCGLLLYTAASCDTNTDNVIILWRMDATVKGLDNRIASGSCYYLCSTAALKHESSQSQCRTSVQGDLFENDSAPRWFQKTYKQWPFKEFGVNHYANELVRGPSEGEEEKEGL